MEAERDEVPDLSAFTSVDDWVDRNAGPVFNNRSSVDWFIKQNRDELIECGALIPRAGRSGSLLSKVEFPKAVIKILRRKAQRKAA